MHRLFIAIEETRDGKGARVRLVTCDDVREFTLGPANRKTPIRFAVGRPGRRSTMWRLWANSNKDDVYLATRQSAGIFKISLHASGDWRLQWVANDHGDVAFTKMGSEEPQGRILQRWSPPPETAPGWMDALSLWVPAQDVSGIPGDSEPWQDVQWIERADRCGATEFRLVLANPERLRRFDLTESLQDPDTALALVNGFRLRGGDVVLLWAWNHRLDAEMQQRLIEAREAGRTQAAFGYDLAPATGPRTLAINEDQDGRRNLWDLSLSPGS